MGGSTVTSRTGRGRLVALAVVPLLGLGLGGIALARTSPGTESRPASVTAGRVAERAHSPADVAEPVVTDLAAGPADPPPGVVGDGGGARAESVRPLTAATARLDATSRAITTKEINAALARRTSALRARDEKAFLATFDPARTALVATQRTLFRNLVRLPLTSPVYRASGITGPATGRRCYVSLVHQFRGVDAEPAELSKVEQWTRRNGAVVTTTVSPLPGQSAARYAPLDQTPLVVRNGPLVTVVAADDGDLDAVAPRAEKAAAAVRAVWGRLPGPARFVVFVGHDPRALATWFGAKNSPPQAIAVAMPQVAMNHQTRFAGSRVVVDLSRTADERLYRVLRHEFTHALDVRSQAVPRRNAAQAFPTWVEEGLAAWVEELDVPLEDSTYVHDLRILRRYWTRGLPPATRSAFYASGEHGVYNYDAAATVFRYLQVRWGTSKALAFYSAMAGGNARAAWKQLGTDQAAFTRAWAAWVDDVLAA